MRRRDRIAVERDERDVALVEGVIRLPSHVERREVDLTRKIVVAERCAELDPRIQELLVRIQELLPVVLSRFETGV